MSAVARVFTSEYRIGVVKRILAGDSTSSLSQELAIKRSVLYRWRDAYRKEGEAGLNRPTGRPPGPQPAQDQDLDVRHIVQYYLCQTGRQRAGDGIREWSTWPSASR